MSPGSAPVLIVGAGPGGLVLAHALRKNDIPFEIFERDSIDQVRPQGWAVALHEYVVLIVDRSVTRLTKASAVFHL